MTTSDLHSMSLDELRAANARAKAYRSSLKTELDDYEVVASYPTTRSTDKASYVSEALIDVLAESEQRLLFYRTTGWSLFEFDLDVGQRSRRETEIDPNVALGVRLDTFYDGRFYTPVYLLLDIDQPERRQLTAKIVRSTLDSTQCQSELKLPSLGLRILSHTVPSQVPLPALLRRYFGVSPSQPRPNVETARGLQMQTVKSLGQEPAFELFLSDVHSQIQASLSRQEQAASLRHIPIAPLLSLSESVGPLELSGVNIATGSFEVRWTLPLESLPSTAAEARRILDNWRSSSITVHIDVRDEKAALATSVNSDQVRSDEVPQQAFLRTTIVYSDPYADRLTAPANAVPAEEDAWPPLPATYTSAGSVRMELVELFAPAHLGEPQRRKTHRRADLERFFCAAVPAGEMDKKLMANPTPPRDLRYCFEDVMRKVWAERLGKVPP